jgi:hypothetical protein
MKYDKRLNNIWKSCSKEESRFALASLHLDVPKKSIVSTDGHMITITDVSDFIDKDEESYLIPSEAFKFAQSISKKNAPPVRIEKRDKAVAVVSSGLDRRFYYPGDKSMFPKWEAAIPDHDEYKSRIVFSAELLLQLSQSIQGSGPSCGVSVWFKDRESPLIVSLGIPENRYALLMPMRGEPKMPAKFWVKKPLDAGKLKNKGAA